MRNVVKDFNDIEIIFAQLDTALPLLREAYERADSDQDNLTYAHILGILGDPSGAGTLAKAVAAREWDKGWKYTGMGQYGPSMSPLDSLIIALGRTRRERRPGADPGQGQPVGARARVVPSPGRRSGPGDARATRAAAKPLADLLGKPGMTGHAWIDINAATKQHSAQRRRHLDP